MQARSTQLVTTSRVSKVALKKGRFDDGDCGDAGDGSVQSDVTDTGFINGKGFDADRHDDVGDLIQSIERLGVFMSSRIE